MKKVFYTCDRCGTDFINDKNNILVIGEANFDLCDKCIKDLKEWTKNVGFQKCNNCKHLDPRSCTCREEYCVMR